MNIPVATVPPVVNTPVATVPPIVHHLTEETKIKEEAKTENVEQVKTPLEPFMKTEEVVDNSNVEFEIIQKAPIVNKPIEVPSKPIEPPVIVNQTEQVVENTQQSSDEAAIVSEEQKRKAQERIEKLKQLSYKLKNNGSLSDLENEPAYKRRNVELEQTQHSSESSVSRYTLSEGEDKKTELKPNNGFLHDNVD